MKNQSIKKILWLCCRDIKHPLAGGAEIVNEEIAKRLVKHGYKIIFVVSGFKGCQRKSKVHGYNIVRVGNRWTIYWHAYRYYKSNLMGWADLVIDGANDIPLFSSLYAREPKIVFFQQIQRKVWFYQMWFPLSIIGYFAEMFYLRLYRKMKVIMVSQSNKNELLKYGHKKNNIVIISEGIKIKPVSAINKVKKFKEPTILCLGAVRPMKRTIHILKAFELAKRKVTNLKLIVAGGLAGRYGRLFIKRLSKSPAINSVRVFGQVSEKEKTDLMRCSNIFCMTSVREGWGLVVTEAASQGTPTISYDVDGLCDSVKNGETGILCKRNNPAEMANEIIKLLGDQKKYSKLQLNGWMMAKAINFDKCTKDFIKAINNQIK